MRRVIPLGLLASFMIFSFSSALLPGQESKKDKKPKGKFDPPETLQPTGDELARIQAKTAELAARIDVLRKDPKHHELLPDVEVYLRGAINIVRFKEFFDKNSVKWTLDTLDRGLKRAEDLRSGAVPWTGLTTPNVLRAYRSVIDGTAQAYGVTYPASYGKDVERVYRVDVVLHGRNGKLTEVAFLNAHNGSKKSAPEQDWVQIDVFCPGNNAYRWAGETDVMEAMNAFFATEEKAGRGQLIDRRKVVLRGFSMGGAGAWHLGLHFPDRWCVMGPGAGFTTTHDYAWKGKKDLPDHQERCLRIYDAVDYVENARMIPIVAYSGGDDAQKLAADNIENRLKALNINAMTHLIAPGVGHSFVPDYFKKANALWAEHARRGRPTEEELDKISFVTYTLKFSTCSWLAINRLDEHYKKTTVDAQRTANGFVVTTSNVRDLSLLPSRKHSAPLAIMIDGQELRAEGKEAIFLSRNEGKWQQRTKGDIVKEFEQQPFKLRNLQGPIDDAFATGFVCVVGSGPTWHPTTQKYVDAKVAAFKHDWAKHWRGELPTTGDYAVNPNDIKDKHLILFGDPSSNLTLAQMLPKLPVKWTKDEIEFAGQKYKSAEHVPVLIFPNPLNPTRYVVLNTGHTIPSEDYTKTNALLYPRLGDYAILRLTATAKNAAAHEVATAGLFNEYWQVEKK